MFNKNKLKIPMIVYLGTLTLDNINDKIELFAKYLFLFTQTIIIILI